MFVENKENLEFILGRESNLFSKDIIKHENELSDIIEKSTSLIIELCLLVHLLALRYLKGIQTSSCS